LGNGTAPMSQPRARILVIFIGNTSEIGFASEYLKA